VVEEQVADHENGRTQEERGRDPEKGARLQRLLDQIKSDRAE
jgi:hypothetical protein